MTSSLPTSYRANGKLLISGEYLVLHGAQALAIPLKYGQKIEVKPNPHDFFKWGAYSPSGLWMEMRMDEAFNLIDTTSYTMANTLISILKQVISYRPNIVNDLTNKTIETHLEFDTHWGWGSSSTLLSCLAQWLGVNPYLLLQDTFGGSGYDIACATSGTPITYSLTAGIPIIQPVKFAPAFKNHIYFIYTGCKQSSKNELKRISNHTIQPQHINRINELTNLMLECDQLDAFGQLVNEHESIIGHSIKRTPIKIEQFADFKGYIKSLGAWGGDFIMVVTEKTELYVHDYFKKHHLHTIFKYNDITIS